MARGSRFRLVSVVFVGCCRIRCQSQVKQHYKTGSVRLRGRSRTNIDSEGDNTAESIVCGPGRSKRGARSQIAGFRNLYLTTGVGEEGVQIERIKQ